MAENIMSDQVDLPDRSQAIVRPPLLYFFAIVGGVVLERLLPLGDADSNVIPSGTFVGTLAIIAGFAVFAAAMRGFSRAETNVPTTMPTTAIVTCGVYRFSRNPIYLGMTLFYLGLSFVLQNVYMLILLVPVLLVMRYGVIAREEAYLERKFGEDYLSYKQKVRRWL